jgi:hypothetical protein
MARKNKEVKTNDEVFVKITVEYFGNTKKVLLFDDKEFAEQKYNELVDHLHKEKAGRSFITIDSSLFPINDIRFVHFEPLPGFSNHMLVLIDTTIK